MPPEVTLIIACPFGGEHVSSTAFVLKTNGDGSEIETRADATHPLASVASKL